MGVEDSGSPEEPPKPTDTGGDEPGSDEKGEVEHADADHDGDSEPNAPASADSTSVEDADADDIGDDEVPGDDSGNEERQLELKPDDPRWDGQWNSTSAETGTDQPATAAERQADSGGASQEQTGNPYEGSYDHETGEVHFGDQDQGTDPATPGEHLPGDTTGGAWQERFSPGGDDAAPPREDTGQAEAADKPNRDEVGTADDDVPEEPEEDPLNESEEAIEYVDKVAEGPLEERRSEAGHEETKTGHENTETRTGHEARFEAVPPAEPAAGDIASALMTTAALIKAGPEIVRDTVKSIFGDEPSMMPEEPKTSDNDDKK